MQKSPKTGPEMAKKGKKRPDHAKTMRNRLKRDTKTAKQRGQCVPAHILIQRRGSIFRHFQALQKEQKNIKIVILPKSPYFVVRRPKTAKYCEKTCNHAHLKIETWEYLSILLGMAKRAEKEKNYHFAQKSIFCDSEAKNGGIL